MADRERSGTRVARTFPSSFFLSPRRGLAVFGGATFPAFAITAWLVGGMLVAPANRSVGPPPDDLQLASTTIVSQSGSTLAVWYNVAEESRATVILLHPIRGNRRSMLDRARLARQAGFSVVLVDLQAHGESPGEQITVGHRERHDVRAVVDFVRAMNPDHRVGLIGCSLGGAAALLASPLDVDAMVLESVYPTISDAVHNRVRKRLGLLSHVVAPALLCQLRPRLGITAADLRPIDRVAHVGCPVLFAGGRQDDHTPPSETRRLFDSARDPKELVLFDGAAHVDLLRHDPDLYRQRVLSFLDTHLAP